MTKHEQANHYHAIGYGCAQSVLAAYAADYNLNEEMALRISTGFGSGMGRLCEVCGALAGGFMVIGLKHGKVITDGTKYGTETETSYRLVTELATRFKEKNGTILCREILNLDLSKPEDRERAVKEGLFANTCNKCILDVVDILEEIL